MGLNTQKEPILIFFPGYEKLAEGFIAHGLSVETFEQRHFPDEESYLRFSAQAEGKEFAIVCSLDRADKKFLMLYFLAKLLKDKGAKKVGLIAPYLGYMRQDKEFHSGEAITSKYFASLISQSFDWLVTIDPHLHRYKNLREIYQIPAEVAHAAPQIAKWIQINIQRPLLIGPDDESSQWVSEIAKDAKAPFVVAQKIRTGDRSVQVSIPNIANWHNHQPVLIDDIVSSGRTMIETVLTLTKSNMQAPVCIAVHPIFADRAYIDLVAARPQKIVSCNTIIHESNAIDVTDLL